MALLAAPDPRVRKRAGERCSIGNSKSQLHKARMRLRELLHEEIREKAREERRAAGSASNSED